MPEGIPKDILEKGVGEATQVVSIPPENSIVFNDPVREFPSTGEKLKIWLSWEMP